MEIRAEMVSTVYQVLSVEGDLVAAGETLIVLESMKMEIPVEAPAAGRVAKILVRPGDVVEEGAVVALLEDDGAGPSDQEKIAG